MIPANAVDRGVVDDGSLSSRQHEWNRLAGTQELALQIDIDEPLPLLVCRFSHSARRLDSSVVDQDVQTAVQIDRGAEEPGRVLVACDVARDCRDLRRQRLGAVWLVNS